MLRNKPAVYFPANVAHPPLLAAKADVNAKTDDGATALLLAKQADHQTVVQLLKSAGAVDR